MAESPRNKDELPGRVKANAALVFATLALLLALVCVVLTIGARNRAETANDTANQTKQYAEETVNKALNDAKKATPGGGVGPDSERPAEGQNLYPSVNGQ